MKMWNFGKVKKNMECKKEKEKVGKEMMSGEKAKWKNLMKNKEKR